ncbi:MAG: hypothetical protein JWM16_846 [Verrucomicrobiales bacterium]|nr:hypothetical protein [Verrucomicrobiales bacterium]
MNITPEVEKEAPEECKEKRPEEKARQPVKDSEQITEPEEFPVDLSRWGLNE